MNTLKEQHFCYDLRLSLGKLHESPRDKRIQDIVESRLLVLVSSVKSAVAEARQIPASGATPGPCEADARLNEIAPDLLKLAYTVAATQGCWICRSKRAAKGSAACCTARILIARAEGWDVKAAAPKAEETACKFAKAQISKGREKKAMPVFRVATARAEGGAK